MKIVLSLALKNCSSKRVAGRVKLAVFGWVHKQRLHAGVHSSMGHNARSTQANIKERIQTLYKFNYNTTT